MRRARTFFALSLAAAALYAPALRAAEAGSKPGLPQLDMSLFPEQLFWLAVSFGLLYVLMAFVALPGVRRIQDRRQDTIAADLAAAQAAQEDAKSLITQYEKALADARVRAQATIAATATAADKDIAARQAAQQHELTERLRAAEAKIAAAREAAIRDVRGAASDLANAVVEKVAGFPLAVQEPAFRAPK